MEIRYYNYKTLNGDTFDSIALDFYSDEFLSSEIIKLNPQYSSTLIFDANITLKIPILEESKSLLLPPWMI